jgi:SOS response regulatory protein OraA/RecX
MLIAKIKHLPDTRVEVKLEDGTRLVVSPDTWFEHGSRLEAGQPLPSFLLQTLSGEAARLACLSRAQGLLAQRGHARSELRRKMLTGGKYPRDLVDSVLEHLSQRGLLDDSQMAADFGAELRSRGIASRAIQTKLRAKGVSAETVAASQPDRETLRQHDWEALLVCARRKLISLKKEVDPRKKRDKLSRHLASRGFPGDLIGRAVGQLLRGGDPDAEL